MKVVTWNIRGVSDPHKIKTLRKKLRMEKPTIVFSARNKMWCRGYEGSRKQIWKGSETMAIDAHRMVGGLSILWHPEEVCISNLWAMIFFLLSVIG